MINLSRRDLLKSAGGLLLGFAFPTSPELIEYNPGASTDRGPDGEWLGAYVCIDPGGVVTLRVPASEMGQGVHTSLPMILAEELDLDLAAVRVEMAPNSTAYAHPGDLGKQQLTAGSGSVRGWWTPMAIAGATARAMLVQAAAQRWGVPAADCATASGRVTCGARSASYGELAVEAAALKVPDAAPKPRAQRRCRWSRSRCSRARWTTRAGWESPRCPRSPPRCATRSSPPPASGSAACRCRRS